MDARTQEEDRKIRKPRKIPEPNPLFASFAYFAVKKSFPPARLWRKNRS